MAFNAAEVFRRVQRIVQDETNVRWALAELRLWLNDALSELALQKPTATAKTVVLTLQAGTYQELPSGYIALLRVVRNVASASDTSRIGRRAITAVQREILDAQVPDWHDTSVTPPSATVKHVVYDQADPKSFYVFPPSTGTGAFVEAIVSAAAPQVGSPANAENIGDAAYTATIPIDDIYLNPLVDFVLYRAYSKDAHYAGNTSRAALHYQQFANSLGIKVQVEAAVNPNVKPGNENAIERMGAP